MGIRNIYFKMRSNAAKSQKEEAKQPTGKKKILEFG